jgi:death-on-curing family protein
LLFVKEISVRLLLKIHSDVEDIFQFGPLDKGVRSESDLEIIVQRPSQIIFRHKIFLDIYSKCACLINEIVRLHAFNNGNKRTALLAAHVFMLENGYNLIIPHSAVKYCTIIAEDKKYRISVEDIVKWIRPLSCPVGNTREYYQKFKEYRTKPERMVYNLNNSGSKQLKIIADMIISDWYSYDKNPEYKGQFDKASRFVSDILNKPPPPPPPPPLAPRR